MNDSEVITYVSNRIRYYREKNNLAQRELARRVGITQQTIARYECGERKIDEITLFKIANFFKISISDLFPPTKYNNKVSLSKIPVYSNLNTSLWDSKKNIIQYVDISSDMVKNGKMFFATTINSNDMFPLYNQNDIVIFEKCDKRGIDSSIDNKECLVKIYNKVILRKVLVNNFGIVLIPYNTSLYDIKMYSFDKIKNIKLKIVATAVEKRKKLNSFN